MVSPLGAIVGQWIFWFISTIFVVLRFYVHWWLQGQMSVGDGFIILAMLCTTYTHSIDTVFIRWLAWDETHSLGGSTGAPPPSGNSTDSHPTQVVALTPYQREQLNRTVISFKLIYVSAVAYYSTMWSVKMSFLLFYYKLFPKRLSRLRMCLHGTTVLTVCGWIIVIFMNFFYCKGPISRNWDFANPQNLCLSYDRHESYYTTVAFHLLTDVLIYAMPFFLLPTLSLSPRKKLSVAAVFGLGLLCIITAVCRIAFFAMGATITVGVLWGGAEEAVAIIVACSPPLKWLYLSFKFHGRKSSEVERQMREKEEERGLEWGTIRLPALAGRWTKNGNLASRSTGTTGATIGTGLDAVNQKDEERVNEKTGVLEGDLIDLERNNVFGEVREVSRLDGSDEITRPPAGLFQLDSGSTEPRSSDTHIATGLSSPYRNGNGHHI